MWFFLPCGFFSAVDKNDANHPDSICIRARFADDLGNLRRDFMPELGATIEGGGTDYPFRAWIAKDAYAEGMKNAALSIDYSNFKSKVRATMGYARSHVYSDVWSVLNRAGRAALRGTSRTIQRQRGRGRNNL